ncbi:2Fe-2S iron-sulfur cluster-binding protein [Novosphingobium terrae]|uniref:2Fe-2S iron-sulfur cluster-binding protein n=1 Tax=Novosphingobium terrae TaxID=2726189 RepID=UPI00197ED7E7|nr:2Fe-2S iron-sulfur cluster-binding protein [Novosphingobium terrae]
MPTLIIVNRSGDKTAVEVSEGMSVMEAIRDNGFDELLAMCGGNCSCATCHVFVDAPWLAATGQPGEDEDDLLDSSDHRSAGSRLSCQIAMTAGLDGLRVTIAPED